MSRAVTLSRQPYARSTRTRTRVIFVASSGLAIASIDIGPGKRVLVVESATGAIDEIRKGETQTIATVPGAVDVAASAEGKIYAVTGGPGPDAPPAPPGSPLSKLVQIGQNGQAEVIADIGAYEAQNPDPDDINVPPSPTESNLNGLALLPGQGILVADAASNRLLLVGKHGDITTVARFRPEQVAGTLPNPPSPTVPAEAVPTAVAVGPDGAYYVSELTGFPFTKGAARIWRIAPGTVDAVCHPASPDLTGRCQSVATGFSSVIDLTFGRDGTMYVLEIAKNGLAGALVLGTEFPPIGALWAVQSGSRTAISDSLVAPGGVAVDDQGDIFVTTLTFGPPGGTVVNIGGAP
jgi:hypothetical protein